MTFYLDFTLQMMMQSSVWNSESTHEKKKNYVNIVSQP